MIVVVRLSDYTLRVEMVFCMSWNSFPCAWLGIVCNGIGGVANESKEHVEESSIGNYQWLWRGTQVLLCHNLKHLV
jgi:hypothetical protein